MVAGLRNVDEELAAMVAEGLGLARAACPGPSRPASRATGLPALAGAEHPWPRAA